MQVSLLSADDQQSTLAHLAQLYLYDLSEIEGLDVQADGLFADSFLAAHWREPDRASFLIDCGGVLAGFALADRRSRIHSGGSFAGRSVAGLFVVRRYRRRGIGSAAAAQLFDRFPGRWEIATYGANVPALSFWRSVSDSYTGGRYHEVWHQDKDWRGSVQSFDSPGSRGS